MIYYFKTTFPKSVHLNYSLLFKIHPYFLATLNIILLFTSSAEFMIINIYTYTACPYNHYYLYGIQNMYDNDNYHNRFHTHIILYSYNIREQTSAAKW